MEICKRKKKHLFDCLFEHISLQQYNFFFQLSSFCSISMRLLLSRSDRIFCLAYSSGKGNFSRAVCTSKHGFISDDRICIPLTRMANSWAISLWHKRCLDVGHGNRLIREHSSDNCGFKPSQRVSMSRSWIVFKLSICQKKKNWCKWKCCIEKMVIFMKSRFENKKEI